MILVIMYCKSINFGYFYLKEKKYKIFEVDNLFCYLFI